MAADVASSLPAPAAPLRVIVPAGGRVTLGLGELWEYRELLGFLVWRDVKVRYKQTVLGAAWAVLQPLATMAMFTVLFGRWAGMPSDGAPYPLFAFAALIPWTFFSTAVGGAANSLVGNTHLISKVYFPRLIISLSSIGAALVDLAIALAVMLAMLALYGVGVSWRLVLLPVPMALLVFVAVAAGAVLGAMCAVYRDVRYVVPFLLQFWMFASPVIYPVSLIPPEWRWLAYLNPLVGAIDGFRSALLGRPLPWTPIAAACAVTLVASVLGLSYFRHVERRVADLV